MLKETQIKQRRKVLKPKAIKLPTKKELAIEASYRRFELVLKSVLKCEIVRELFFAKELKRQFRFDFAIPEKKIAIESEGGVWTNGRHTRGKGYISDLAKYNLAILLGWRVLRFTPDQLLKTETIELIEQIYKQ